MAAATFLDRQCRSQRGKDVGLAPGENCNYYSAMSAREIAEAVMELPEPERLELARRIVASVVAERENSAEIAEAVRGIEDVILGKVQGLSEAAFQATLR